MRKIMTKIMTKITSFILSLILALNLTIPALALDYEYTEDNYIKSQQDIESAREAYESLSPEARRIFEQSLAYDTELREFHQTYVDSNYKSYTPKIMARAAIVDPLQTLTYELSLLGLPTAVTYSLKAMGAGMVAAIADGPLPVGDILLAAAAASAVAIIAVNWNSVAPKWNKIVNAFKKAFSTSKTNITKAFQSISSDVKKNIATSPSVTLSGKNITINGVRYNCTTKADELSRKNPNRYYPAILYGNTVYVDSNHPVSTTIAKLFMYSNHPRVGIWATSSSYARGLCGGNNAIHDMPHSLGDGFFPHYHHPNYRNFHCWYL